MGEEKISGGILSRGKNLCAAQAAEEHPETGDGLLLEKIPEFLKYSKKLYHLQGILHLPDNNSREANLHGILRAEAELVETL
jgi:hypothetical protein